MKRQFLSAVFVLSALLLLALAGCGDNTTHPGMATVAIDANAPDAEVFIWYRGGRQSTEPAHELPYIATLEPGTYGFSFNATGYRNEYRELTLAAGDKEELFISFIPVE